MGSPAWQAGALAPQGPVNDGLAVAGMDDIGEIGSIWTRRDRKRGTVSGAPRDRLGSLAQVQQRADVLLQGAGTTHDLAAPGDQDGWDAAADFHLNAVARKVDRGQSTVPSLNQLPATDALTMPASQLLESSHVSLVEAVTTFESDLQTIPHGDMSGLIAAGRKFENHINRNAAALEARMASNTAKIDELFDLAQRLQHEDPARAEKLGRMATALDYENRVLFKEREKQEKVRRLMALLIIGTAIPKGLINELRAMGLGGLVDRLVGALANRGGLSRSAAAVLRDAGFGALVRHDEELHKLQDMQAEDTDVSGRKHVPGTKSGDRMLALARARTQAIAGQGLLTAGSGGDSAHPMEARLTLQAQVLDTSTRLRIVGP